MNTDGHFTLDYNEREGHIRALACVHCTFRAPRRFPRPGDKSGLPVYNRMRGVMVKHLHANHRGKLAEGPGWPSPDRV